MHLQPVLRGQFRRQFVDRQISSNRDPACHPILDTAQLAATGIAPRLWRKRSGLALEAHHVIDELDRNARPPRRFGVRVALPDKRNGAGAQPKRMRFPHLSPP
jgi:hypothetical protein